MLEWLATLDRAIFLFINVQLANPVTDFCMPIITSDMVLRVLYAIVVVLILWKGNRQLRWTVLVSGVALLLTDQISAHLMKGFFERPRPCHSLDEINLLVNCGAGFSMPSAHAANAFGQATVWGLRARTFVWPLLIFAFLIAISRVFVGVHYPGDVLVGMLVGASVGIAVHYFGARWVDPSACAVKPPTSA
jgi:undecaprenyl-diphosphatase